ncbi:MAG: DNA-3-methyladenine glycosylase I [Promethearchaeota archaeon]|nr:MAG: DNA-3-methyladenine glycosylase I [Candidatus Lokiarchaeota archaeon]
MTKKRCEWAFHSNLMKKYHDTEWGVPQHDDKVLFEFIVLESVQAGLSWDTILNKRENFRKAFDNFDYSIIAKYTEEKIENLLQNKGIIRNRLKIKSIITNARSFLEIQKEFGTFDEYIWSFANRKPIVNSWSSLNEIPSNTELSEKISKDLKRRGFKFIGRTIIYAFMQAVGIVNDHTIYCFRHDEIKQKY